MVRYFGDTFKEAWLMVRYFGDTSKENMVNDSLFRHSVAHDFFL